MLSRLMWGHHGGVVDAGDDLGAQVINGFRHPGRGLVVIVFEAAPLAVGIAESIVQVDRFAKVDVDLAEGAAQFF